ncbi:MAG: VOC family protein [Pseudomonadota bacterium]
MSASSLIASIGPVMQLAFVPEDFDAAITHWTKVMGVGPFFWIEQAGLRNARFEGRASDVDFGLAIAYWGDVQIELIKQHNDAPSIYRSAPYARAGLHHMCVLTDDIGKSRSAAEGVGATFPLEADAPGGGAVFYADCGGDQGLIEVLQPAPGSLGFFDMMKETAKGWDGADPVRPVR